MSQARYIADFVIQSNNIADGAVTFADVGSLYTSNVTENTSLYFTNARATAAVVAGAAANSILFVSSAGVLANSNTLVWTGSNLGIGTGTPGSKLDVAGSTYVRGDSSNATFTSPGQLAIKRSTNSPFLSFHQDDGSRIGYLFMQGAGVSALWLEVNQDLRFATNNTERARITGLGYFGIGTSSPGGLLTVGAAAVSPGSAFNANLLVNAGTLGGTAGNTVKIANLSFDSVTNNHAGLGITAYRNTTGNDWTTSGVKFTFDVDNTTAVYDNLLCFQGGNIGIGTSSPGSFGQGGKFVVAGSAGGTYVDSTGVNLVLDGNGTNTASLIYFRYSSGGTLSADSYLVFKTGSTPTERVRITSGGDVGIGTTNPLSKFDSYAGVSLASVQRTESSSAGAIAINVAESRVANFNVVSGSNFVISNGTVSASGWRVIFRGTWSNNYEGGGLSQYASYIEINSANPSIVIGSRTLTVSRNGSGYLVVNCNDAYRISFAGTIEVYDNPQSLQPYESMRLLGGIRFPATQNASSDANTLDDYEEGTWTPSAYISYQSGTITTTSSTGTYTKIGRYVYCYFDLTINLTWSVAGNIGVSGLPFNAAAIYATGGAFGGARRHDAGGEFYSVEGVYTNQIQVIRRYDNGGFGSASGIRITGWVIYTV